MNGARREVGPIDDTVRCHGSTMLVFAVERREEGLGYEFLSPSEDVARSGFDALKPDLHLYLGRRVIL